MTTENSKNLITPSNNSSNKNGYSHLVAGGIAGCIAKSLTAPLDRIKILFQAQNPEFSKFTYRPFGIFHAAGEIFRVDGIRGLFQGHLAMILRIFPSASIRFYAFEKYNKLITPEGTSKSPLRTFAAGSLAGNTAVIFTYPLEVIRSRLAYEIRNKGKDYGILYTTKLILKENNNSFRGFFKGFGPTMYGVIPYAGAAFSTHQTLKDYFKSDSIILHLLIGGIAGMVGQTASYPFDTIRHRMQLDGVAKNIPKYKNTLDAFYKIYRFEGIRGFFIGITINYWKTIPANAVAFVVYDYLMNKWK
jgi:solute carrier family 25 protein 16